MYFVKYIFLETIGWIFNLSTIVKIQYYELLKFFFKFNLFVVPLCLVLRSINYIGFPPSYLAFFILISLLIILLRISFLIFKLTPFRNLYLFSYLCTTEILPLFIIIKAFLL
jgi:hypothetical protein